MKDFPINPNTGKPFGPITEERLQELDRWYRECKSNSLMFCDADYLEMRATLTDLKTRLDAAMKVINAIPAFLDRSFIAKDGTHMACITAKEWSEIYVAREAFDALGEGS